MRRRLGRFVCFAIILAIASPSFGVASHKRVRCEGGIKAHGKASCVTSFTISHFNSHDSFDYNSLDAKIISPQASAWRVSGSISDARGVVYFMWYCSAQRSSVTVGATTYAGHSCEASRRTVAVRRNGRTYRDYYVADTSKPQRLTVNASVGACTRSMARPCRFEAAATYDFAS